MSDQVQEVKNVDADTDVGVNAMETSAQPSPRETFPDRLQKVEDGLAEVLPIAQELASFAKALADSNSGHTLGSFLMSIGKQFIAEL